MFRSPQAEFILKEWLPAFERRDLVTIEKLMHEEFLHTVCPKSLGCPEENKAQTLERLAGYFPRTTASKVSRINRCSSPLHRG